MSLLSESNSHSAGEYAADTEGAKEILVEVQQEGSDQQKQQANELIDSISK